MSEAATVQTFTTTLLATGGNNVGLPVPDDVVAAFDRGRRVPVVVTVDDDYTYRTTVSVMDGRFLVSFNAETRRATGRGAGDEVAVRLEVDDAPRTVDVPPALAAALADRPGAAAAWAALSPSKQKAHALSVEGARTDETRDRRVAKVLDALTA
ncbi:MULTISPECIES: YdeI/OmpD-associated family protein [unclassified Isoptericola]|uniref:YdeI/OmpD-associated family protein n=1 Tax=unclassified Isoptericola TaxID=2623355 RepID=UPI00364D971C